MGKQVKKHGYSCKLVRVVDGDTCDALIDLGFDVWIKSRIRFIKGEEKSVNELLKENGHAYEYHGEKKKVFGS
jgi:hypothetical protein